MKDFLIKIKEKIINNKEKIKKVILIATGIAVIVSGLVVGGIYSYANSNMNYSQNQLQEIAIKRILGEVVNIKRELEFEDAEFEYTFYIKDKENMLHEISLSSKHGAITDIEKNSHDSDGNNSYDD